ncbi:glycosyltransferase, partial [Pseudoalteromonas sp. Angola-31]|nr:glycosyltransferase [Pseudoalteromonas sp. Angola-31]
MLSVVVPTFNERETVRIISDRIAEALKSEQFEILFVDDSLDDTPKILAELAVSRPYVSFFHRTGERGLATAVLFGISQAKG